MNLLLAHHVEAQHVPVLLALFAVGSWLGWSLVSRIVARRAKPGETHADSSEARH